MRNQRALFFLVKEPRATLGEALGALLGQQVQIGRQKLVGKKKGGARRISHNIRYKRRELR